MSVQASAMLQLGQDFQRPESLLIGKRNELADKVREQQAVADLVSAQNRLFFRILKLSPDMRQKYFAALRASGLLDRLAEMEKLDQKVIAAHPDLEEREDRLAGAEAWAEGGDGKAGSVGIRNDRTRKTKALSGTRPRP
jgi:hypothetical protein